MTPTPVLAEVVRSGFVESRHHGSLVVLGSDGSVQLALGEVTTPFYPRSSNKPVQALGMLRAGLDLEDELLALVSASHSGEDFHVDGVRQILAGAGLTERDLRCPPSFPIDRAAMLEQVRRGEGETRLAMNCSGKHAGMLATCIAAGWPTSTYTDPTHPLQQVLRETFEEYTGEKVAHTGVDGCGAPLFATSLAGLARAFRSLLLAPEGSYARRIVDAVRAYPTRTSGTRREEAALIAGVPGLFCKGGAEGCFALGLSDGRALALKIEDGAGRATPVIVAAALRHLGITEPVVEEQSSVPVLGGGEPVGEIRPAPHPWPSLP